MDGGRGSPFPELPGGFECAAMGKTQPLTSDSVREKDAKPTRYFHSQLGGEHIWSLAQAFGQWTSGVNSAMLLLELISSIIISVSNSFSLTLDSFLVSAVFSGL